MPDLGLAISKAIVAADGIGARDYALNFNRIYPSTFVIPKLPVLRACRP
jgi:hypothetical protein